MSPGSSMSAGSGMLRILSTCPHNESSFPQVFVFDLKEGRASNIFIDSIFLEEDMSLDVL